MPTLALSVVIAALLAVRAAPQSSPARLHVVGGPRSVDGDVHEGVRAAAAQALFAYVSARGDAAATPALPALAGVLDATTQVVAGAKYAFRLAVADSGCGAAAAATPAALALCAPAPGAATRTLPAAFTVTMQAWAKPPRAKWTVSWKAPDGREQTKCMAGDDGEDASCAA